MGTRLRNQEQGHILHVRGIPFAQVSHGLLKIMHNAETGATKIEDEPAKHVEILLLQTRRVLLSIVHEDINDTTGTNSDPKSQYQYLHWQIA